MKECDLPQQECMFCGVISWGGVSGSNNNRSVHLCARCIDTCNEIMKRQDIPIWSGAALSQDGYILPTLVRCPGCAAAVQLPARRGILNVSKGNLSLDNELMHSCRDGL